MSPEGSISVSPLNMVFNGGDNVTLNCSAQGGPDNTYQWQQRRSNLDDESFPNPMYQWQHDGVDLMNETSNILTIDNIDAVNGGNYTCVVSNAAGNDSATSTLYVAPTIVTQPADILTRNGTVVNFTCEAESFPAPEYQWEKYNETMGTFIRVSRDPVLEFSPAVFGDEGRYQCVASQPRTNRIDTSRQVVLTGR